MIIFVFLTLSSVLFIIGFKFIMATLPNEQNQLYAQALSQMGECSNALTNSCLISYEFAGSISQGKLTVSGIEFTLKTTDLDPQIGMLNDNVYFKAFTRKEIEGVTIFLPISVTDLINQSQTSQMCITGKYTFFNKIPDISVNTDEVYFVNRGFTEIIPCTNKDEPVQFEFTDLGLHSLN